VTKWNNEQQTKNAKGDGSRAIEAWKLPSWLIQKNALSADEKGYVHIYKIERETSKAYLVQLIKDYTPSLAKAILGGGVEWAKHTSKEWIPKSQIEERIPVLSQEKK
jgi:hypothetical protein